MKILPAVGLPGYMVSEDGTIFGLSGKPLAGTVDRGYLKIYPRGGKTLRVHRVVASTFLKQDDGATEVNHKNGNKLDNRAENLEWVTHKENTKHAIHIGLSKVPGKGEFGLRAKLTQEDVDYIRSCCIPYDRLFSETALAKKYNVSVGCIHSIIKNKNWGG